MGELTEQGKSRKAYFNKMKEAGFIYTTLFVHSSYIDEIKKIIKERNVNIKARQVLNLPVVKMM